jgi:Tol biopolymer transport system component
MPVAVVLLALHAMITVDQRDASRNDVDPPSAAIAADGRFVAFTTYLPLAPDDTDERSDVYVLDRASGRLTFESQDGSQARGADAWSPAISGDGRTLVYVLNGRLVVRDRASGATRAIAAGRQPSISYDGTLIAFTSGATDVVPGADANGPQEDIYLLDRETDQVHRISVDTAGSQAVAGESVSPSITADGRFVAFVSWAPLDGAGGNRAQVFVRDTELGTTRRIANGWDPSISGNGRHVAYVAHGNRRTQTEVHVVDLETGHTQLISRDGKGQPANGPSANPVLSGDGRFVAFQSEASNLVPREGAEDFNLLPDVFLFDRETGGMRRISTDETNCWMEASGGPTIDASGSVVAFASKHPTGAADEQNDFDLYIASVPR